MKRMKEVTLAILIMALCCGSGLGKTVKAENVYSYDDFQKNTIPADFLVRFI